MKTMRTYLLSAGFAAILLISAVPSDANAAHVNVRVTQTSYGDSVRFDGADIVVESSAGVQTGVTNDEGTASFENVAAGDVKVTVLVADAKVGEQTFQLSSLVDNVTFDVSWDVDNELF